MMKIRSSDQKIERSEPNESKNAKEWLKKVGTDDSKWEEMT